MSIYDADGNCSKAVDALATSSKSLRERLFYAYNTGLVWIKAEELPEDIRPDYQRLHERLNSKPAVLPNKEGTLQATLRDMSNEEAEDIARLIMKLAHDVSQEAVRQQYRGR